LGGTVRAPDGSPLVPAFLTFIDVVERVDLGAAGTCEDVVTVTGQQDTAEFEYTVLPGLGR
jgi:hypothetical protein